LKNRTQLGCCLLSFWVMLMFLSAIYYLPLFYQAKGHSATKSGVDILPFMLATVSGAMIAGGVITSTGKYWWWLVIGPMFATVASGLLLTLDAHISNAKLIGYQILYGAGCGVVLQNTYVAIQAEYHHDEAMIPRTSTLVTFTQLVGGAIGLAIAGTIFYNCLVIQLHHFAPNLDPSAAENVRNSVTYIFTLPKDQQLPVIEAYARAIRYIFVLPIPCGIFATLSAMMIRDHNIRSMTTTTSGSGA